MIRIAILAVFLFSMLSNGNSYKFLTIQQKADIKTIIQNKNTPTFMREKVNTILFTHYSNYAINKAIKFKKFHHQKCRHIDQEELNICAQVGLINSIKKYNGNHQFTKYSDIYISSELYKAMTQLYPISKISKKVRMSKKLGGEEQEKKTHYLGSNHFVLDNRNMNNISIEKCENLWEIINMSSLDSNTKRAIYYKYNYCFDKIRSNKEVSEMMSFSEEYVRTKLSNIKYEIDASRFISDH
jgi:ribosomal protein S24E